MKPLGNRGTMRLCPVAVCLSYVDDLNHQQDIEKYIHEKSESYGMCFTCSSTQRRAFYFAAATMAKKASALSDAPPISPPSMSGCANSSAALPAFMLPPYRMRIEFA